MGNTCGLESALEICFRLVVKLRIGNINLCKCDGSGIAHHVDKNSQLFVRSERHVDAPSTWATVPS